jgi:hypothetical protein
VTAAPSFLERMVQQLYVVQEHLGGAGGIPTNEHFTIQQGLAMLERDD